MANQSHGNLEPMSVPDSRPVCLFLHTVTATVDDQYGLPDYLQAARDRGFRPVVHVRRGHGELPLLTPRWQLLGDVNDLALALREVRNRYPKAPIVVVALSAGATPLLK